MQCSFTENKIEILNQNKMLILKFWCVDRATVSPLVEVEYESFFMELLQLEFAEKILFVFFQFA